MAVPGLSYRVDLELLHDVMQSLVVLVIEELNQRCSSCPYLEGYKNPFRTMPILRLPKETFERLLFILRAALDLPQLNSLWPQ